MLLENPSLSAPGKLAPETDQPSTDDNQLLFDPEPHNWELKGVAGGEGSLLAIAVPKKIDVKPEITIGMVEHNHDFQFSDIRNEKQARYPVSPQHELQKQPTKSSCAAWPICLATTPYAIGVAPLDADRKLLEPQDYLLGAGWTWIAAPASGIPIAIKAKKQDSEHAGEPLQVAGLYAGTSFAAPIIGALLQEIMDMTPSDTQVSITEVATLIAASSDLASADEIVDFPNKTQKRFIELVRFGRLNIARALYLAKTGQNGQLRARTNRRDKPVAEKIRTWHSEHSPRDPQ